MLHDVKFRSQCCQSELLETLERGSSVEVGFCFRQVLLFARATYTSFIGLRRGEHEHKQILDLDSVGMAEMLYATPSKSCFHSDWVLHTEICCFPSV